MQRILILFMAFLTIASCSKTIEISNGDIRIEFDKNMYSRVNSLNPQSELYATDFQLSDYLESKKFSTGKFKIREQITENITDDFGAGEKTSITGVFTHDHVRLRKTITLRTYSNHPGTIIMNTTYENTGAEDIVINKWISNRYSIKSSDESPELWSFQGSSTDARSDWVLPVTPGFYQKNYMGMNQSDYGGGIPVSDIWRKDGGIAVGHLALVPKEVALPVDYDKYSKKVTLGIEYEYSSPLTLEAGESLNTLETFIFVHGGDYFTTMRRYSELMQNKGIQFAESEPAAFESVWCGWGYERKFTMENIINTLPKVKELGIQWAVIDDGFQIAEGDWRVDTKRFPGGASDMRKMVDAIHEHGLKAKLWWAPLAADPGSKVLEDHPDVLLINEDGAPQYITWWDAYYLSPAAEATLDYTTETIDMFLNEWGFDGLKMDGQHMNAVPADYNWKRPLEYPEKSIELLPDFFKTVYNKAREIKPHAVIENCPCGTCMSFYNMPYTNQTVSSDPLSSWQIRLKGKTYKAIMPQTAYYGDHVELSDNGSDFASSFGIGAVLGTKFTWPRDNPNQSESFLLTPEKEKIWKMWFSLYHKMMLSRGTYLGDLYDIGFDKPETHVIEKEETMYYAFYAEKWTGKIELRGLDETKEYKVYDYVNNIDMGSISGTEPFIETAFDDHLLIRVSGN